MIKKGGLKLGARISKIVNGKSLLITPTGGVFLDKKRINITYRGKKFFRLKKIKGRRKLIEEEILELKGLTICEALIKLGLIC